MKKLTGPVPKSPFNALNLLSKFNMKISFNDTDLSPAKIPTVSDIGIARSLLNQPIFMNQLFVHGNTGMLRASMLCEHFFSVADIWSFQHNDINTTKLQNVKEVVDLRGHPPYVRTLAELVVC